jgi:hypothetical protein
MDSGSVAFIHGLGGDSKSTWTFEPPVTVTKRVTGLLKPRSAQNQAEGSSNVSHTVFWPKDLLHLSLKNVRILTYGYDSDPVGFLESVNRTNIYHHATDMLIALAGERRNDVRDLSQI